MSIHWQLIFRAYLSQEHTIDYQQEIMWKISEKNQSLLEQKQNQEIHYLKIFKNNWTTLRNSFSCKMLSWQIISLVILLVVLLTKGNPLKVSEKKSEKSENPKQFSKLIRRIDLCNYYAYPSYDQYASFSPLSSTDYLFSLRSIRERCRYLVEPEQKMKYSVWDLVR